MWVYREVARKLAEDPLGEPGVLEAPARQHDRQPADPARGAPDQLGARRGERGVEAGRHRRRRRARGDVARERAPQRPQVEDVDMSDPDQVAIWKTMQVLLNKVIYADGFLQQ